METDLQWVCRVWQSHNTAGWLRQPKMGAAKKPKPESNRSLRR